MDTQVYHHGLDFNTSKVAPKSDLLGLGFAGTQPRSLPGRFVVPGVARWSGARPGRGESEECSFQCEVDMDKCTASVAWHQLCGGAGSVLLLRNPKFKASPGPAHVDLSGGGPVVDLWPHLTQMLYQPRLLFQKEQELVIYLSPAHATASEIVDDTLSLDAARYPQTRQSWKAWAKAMLESLRGYQYDPVPTSSPRHHDSYLHGSQQHDSRTQYARDNLLE